MTVIARYCFIEISSRGLGAKQQSSFRKFEFIRGFYDKLLLLIELIIERFAVFKVYRDTVA